MNKPILQLNNVLVQFDGVRALNHISIEINKGELLTIMGPNGAGKSTVLKSLFGLVPLTTGQVLYDGEIIDAVPHQMVKRGISFVPQGRRVFTNLSVEENLEVGGFFLKKKEVASMIQELYKFFPMLKDKRKEKSSSLSGGQQQILAIARGLIGNPKILLLDEPTMGLSPKAVGEIFDLIKKIKTEQRITIVVVEHNLKSLLPISDRVYILDKGEVVHEGSGGGILESNLLERVFLGKKK
jgi:branched-chain amino acid transport system ATP-binding protein